MSEPVLCYVRGSWAYFTTQPLDKQWGDDWNDAPYEHNAGTPYRFSDHDRGQGKEPWEIVEIAWLGNLREPDDGCTNSSYSVESINAGKMPWLRSPDYVREPHVRIFAGASLSEFKRLVRMAGGTVFVEEKAA